MISIDDAVTLLKKYNLPPSRISHSLGVAEFAFSIAKAILGKNPQTPINAEKIRIGAILHDIGRALPGDHEQNTVDILKSEGLNEIAQITMHGSYYEIMVLRGINDETLKPQTLENKIVAYADARYKDHLMTLDERTKEIEMRRKAEPEKIKSMQMAQKRFKMIEDELMELIDDSIVL